MNIATLSRLIENLIRLGTIEEIDLSAKSCRVRSGKLLSNWLPWITLRAGTTRTWNPPSIGEQVLILSPSGEPAGGVILMGIQSALHPTPSSSADEHVTVYPDGAHIAYNHFTGALVASGLQTALIQAATQVTVDCPAVHVTGTVTIDGDAIISGISFLQHVHPDPQGSTVGVPQ